MTVQGAVHGVTESPPAIWVELERVPVVAADLGICLTAKRDGDVKTRGGFGRPTEMSQSHQTT